MRHGAIFHTVGVVKRIDVFSSSWVEVVRLKRVNIALAGKTSLDSVRLATNYVIIFVMRTNLASLHPRESS